MARKPYHEPDTLRRLHHQERLRLSEIAQKYDVTDATIHYHFNKHGINKRPKHPEERFHESYKIDDDSGCWLWQKSKHDFGYGEMGVGDKKVRAHRYSYRIHNGAIDDGSFICHRCNTPECVNPNHLYEGDSQSNVDDAVQAGTVPHDGAFGKGENHRQSKLSEEQVVLMRKRAEYGYSTGTLAEDFGISVHTVRDILNGNRWPHADGPIRD